VTGQIYERVLVNSHHLLLLVAVVVFCAVAFWRLSIETRKFKFDVNLDPSLAAEYGLGDCFGVKGIRLQLIGRTFAHKVDPNWSRAIIALLRRRKIPLSFNVAGRQLTCVMDARGNDISRNVRPADVVDSQRNFAGTSDLALGEFDSKIVRLAHERNLNSSNAMGNESADQCGRYTESEPSCVV
jgi:hypothetical protein